MFSTFFLNAPPWRRVIALAALLGVLTACAQSGTAAQETKQMKAAQINRVTLQRNSTVLVLQRDGKATHTITGSARAGTGEQRFEGAVNPQAFAALAGVLVDKGFFALQDSYADPSLQDGSWATVQVEWGVQSKQVFNRNDAGPPNLLAVQQAIDAVQAQIRFLPAAR